MGVVEAVALAVVGGGDRDIRVRTWRQVESMWRRRRGMGRKEGAFVVEEEELGEVGVLGWCCWGNWEEEEEVLDEVCC